MSLLNRAVHAFKWSLLGELGSRVLSPVIFIVLARLLLPEDFGVVAAATVAVSFSQVFWDTGLAKALIQRQGDTAESADAVFWINLALGLVLMVALIVGAPWIATFFNDDRVAPVLRVLALQLPLASVCSIFTALMYKRLEFRRLFWVRLVTAGAPGLVSIPLAQYGWTYWSLVAGVLVGQVLQLVVLWRLAGWRMQLRMNPRVARELLRFGKWSVASGLLGWVYTWLDAIVVGHYLGGREMGLYRSGNTFVMAVFGVLFAPLLPVLYSLFSRAQHDLGRLRDALRTVTHAMALVIMPIALALTSTSEELGILVFGNEWTGINLVIAMLGLSHAIGWLAGANGELYRAHGKPHVETLVMLAMLTIYTPTYLISVQQGLETFLWARVALSAVALALHAAVCWYVVGIPPNHWLRSCWWAGLAAVLAALVAQQSSHPHLTAGVRLVLTIGIGAAVYGAVIAIAERRFLRQLIDILQSVPPRNGVRAS